jgi:uncharacterized protein (TIGR03437 family)
VRPFVFVFVWVWAAAAQTPAGLFDDRAVQDVWLEVGASDWQALRDNYLLDKYYPASFTWDGETVVSAAIRSRGSGSRSPVKPNLLVSFTRSDSAQRFRGLTAVILKANNQDASLLHELVAMTLFRRMGLPAPREAPARVYVNGQYFGAYTLVERIDAEFIRRNFSEDAGYLYSFEADRTNGYRFEYRGPDPASYSPVLWSPSNQEANPDPGAIAEFVRAVNQAPDAELVSTVSHYLDLSEFVNYLAIEKFLSDFDGFLGRVFGMNNVYFYRLAGATRFQLIPWDKDASFDWEDHSIFEGADDNVLARRVLAAPALRQMFFDALAKTARIAGGEGGWLHSEVERLYQLIREPAVQDVNKQCVAEGVMYTCGASEFEAGVEQARRFAILRAVSVLRQLSESGYDPAASAQPPVVNQILNAATYEYELAPGAIVSVLGRGLASGTVIPESGSPIYEAAGTTALINGVRARILYSSPEQLNIQVPWDLAPRPASLTVVSSGVYSGAAVRTFDRYAPGIFGTSRANGTPVTPANPAAPGELVKSYATGLPAQALGVPLQLAVGDVPVALESLELDASGIHVLTYRVPTAGAGSGPLRITLAVDEYSTDSPLPVQ